MNQTLQQHSVPEEQIQHPVPVKQTFQVNNQSIPNKFKKNTIIDIPGGLNVLVGHYNKQGVLHHARTRITNSGKKIPQLFSPEGTTKHNARMNTKHLRVLEGPQHKRCKSSKHYGVFHENTNFNRFVQYNDVEGMITTWICLLTSLLSRWDSRQEYLERSGNQNINRGHFEYMYRQYQKVRQEEQRIQQYLIERGRSHEWNGIKQSIQNRVGNWEHILSNIGTYVLQRKQTEHKRPYNNNQKTPVQPRRRRLFIPHTI